MKKKLIALSFFSLALVAYNKNIAKGQVLYDNNLIKNILSDNATTEKSLNVFEKQATTYELPKIITNIKENNLSKLEYQADIINYSKNAYNYLIFYSIEDNSLPQEIFRVQLTKSGLGEITDKSLLNKIKNNSKLLLQVMSFEISDKGITNINYSKTSDPLYTKKTVDLVVKEADKMVYNGSLDLTADVVSGNVEVTKEQLEKYKVDKFYSYNNASLLVDDVEKTYNTSNIKIPYWAKKLTINLAKNYDSWVSINVNYPSDYKIENKQYSVKKGSTLGEFLSSYPLKRIFSTNGDYSFDNYYINNQLLSTVEKSQIINNGDIVAKFNTRITLNNTETKKDIYLKTEDSLESIDTAFFERQKYNIKNYSIIDRKTNEVISEVDNLANLKVDKSVEIRANYEAKENTISVRQDDYNKRFGKVDSSVKDLDIKWKQTEPLEKLLEQLNDKIKPNTGYETLFRINKKVVDKDSYIDSDVVLEIYFKKLEESWITVKFTGNGIDKFLSDGQEILVGTRLGSAINLPTATGVNDREFLGWKLADDYTIVDSEGNKTTVSKDILLNTEQLGQVVAPKEQNLEFQAVYRKVFKVTFEPTVAGSITIAKGNGKILNVDEGSTLEEALKNNKLLTFPKSNYVLSHFIANKDVLLKENAKTKQIFKGQQIKEEQIYNIVPVEDLTLTPIFEFENYNVTIEGIMDHNKLYDVSGILGLEHPASENLARILGPLYYLR